LSRFTLLIFISTFLRLWLQPGLLVTGHRVNDESGRVRCWVRFKIKRFEITIWNPSDFNFDFKSILRDFDDFSW